MTDIKYGRKRSGIKRQLKKKVEDWISSLEGEEFQKEVRNNVIVTGGSIASMLLGEKINDYDIYFRTFETTKKVAEYYAARLHNPKMPKARVKVEQRENIKGESEKRVVIWIQSAGVLSDESTEYRYFETLTEDETAEFAESLILSEQNEEGKEKYRPVFMSENAITLSDSVQLITRFYGEPDKIHDNYDFVHATCYWDHKNENLVLSADAMESLLSRTLIYRGSLYPIASIFRMKKFVERGWRITAGQQLKIMWQISEVNLQNWNVLRDQLTGVDMAYMYQITEALKDVPSEKINSAYVAEIIDRIFE